MSYRAFLKKKIHPLCLISISTLLIYGLIVGYVAFADHQLKLELNEYDLNGDGVFSEYEITPEQKEAMRRVISDTARCLAPITGAIFAIGYSVLFFGTYSLVKLKAKKGINR